MSLTNADLAGMPVEFRNNTQTRTRIAEGDIPVGYFAKAGTIERGAVVFNGSGELLGAAIFENQITAIEEGKYIAGENLKVITKGTVYVSAQEAITAEEKIKVSTTGRALPEASGTAGTSINARALTSASIGEYVGIEIDIV